MIIYVQKKPSLKKYLGPIYNLGLCGATEAEGASHSGHLCSQMKPLTKNNIQPYLGPEVPIKRIHFSKEFRAPFFPVIRRILENPLEELVTTRHPEMADIAAPPDGLLLL